MQSILPSSSRLANVLLLCGALALPMGAQQGGLQSGSQIESSAASAMRTATQGYPADPMVEIEQLGDTDAEGSTNVPMDSWIYPALERLSSMGFVPLQSVAIRPWTRKECLRQVRSAEAIVTDDGGLAQRDQEAMRLLGDLEHELGGPATGPATSWQTSDGVETSGLTAGDPPTVLESVYARYGTIAGPAINDSYHFGQTWWNDFGRPQGRGSNVIAGFSVRATHGRFFFYDRQELQQTPTIGGVTAAQANLFNTVLDLLGPQNGVPGEYVATAPSPAYLRQRPIELYAGFAALGNNLSFGKQELYWGPTTMGPLAFSSNAEPTYNLRLVSTRPHPVPFTDGFATYRFDLVFGKFSGHKYPARPYFNGQKLDLTFGKYVEMSFTRWSQLFGVGHAMTLHNLRENLFSVNSAAVSGNLQNQYGNPGDPGDRKSDFDFRLHLPGLANLVTIYADSFADDEPNPIDAPRRVVWNPGIYFARLPYLPHMDLRVEMTSSEELAQDEGGVGVNRFFWNDQYRDSNQNKGFLLGNAIGRDSRAFQFQSKYWVSARTTIEGGYRQNYGGHFLPGGSHISDGFANAAYTLTPTVTLQLFAQYEKFEIQSYLVGKQHNTSGWFEVVWNPKLRVVPPLAAH